MDVANPNQFEIIMLANGNARSNVDNEILTKVGYVKHKDDKGGLGIVNGERKYARIIIRKKNEIMGFKKKYYMVKLYICFKLL